MRSVKDIVRAFKHRLTERTSDILLSSHHFRRTVLRRLFQNHAAPGALAYVTFPDHVFVVDPRDHMIAFSLLSGKPWQRHELERAIAIAQAANTLTPGGWLIDIGANIGTQTIYAMLGGKFRGVVAIEPEPGNARILRRNVDLNGFADRVHVVEAAASGASGTAGLMRDKDNHGAHTIEPGQATIAVDSIAVETKPLDEILAGLGIAASDVAMVTMDVEGHELDVLKGMPGLLRRGLPIVIEVSAGNRDRQKIEMLRAMLGATYSTVAPLLGPAASPGRDLASFDFGTRHIDVLFYNPQPAHAATAA